MILIQLELTSFQESCAFSNLLQVLLNRKSTFQKPSTQPHPRTLPALLRSPPIRMAALNPANFPALQAQPRVNEWRLVIKVKYGDTLRRFGANIHGRSMDHNMSSIRAKIIELFKLSPEAELILTYTDEDGDSVVLDEDEELSDAVLGQRLDPLRISVQLKTVESLVPKSSQTADLTQSLSQLTETTFHTNPVVAEALKSVPEPLRAIVSKVSQDLMVKASSLAALAQLIQLYGPGSPNGSVGGSSSGPTNSATGEPKSAIVYVPETGSNSEEPKSAIVPVPETANNSGPELISKQKGMASIARGSIVATPKPVDLNLDPPRNQLESELLFPNDLYASDLTTKSRTLTTKLKEGLENKGGDAPGGKSTIASPAVLSIPSFPQANSVGAIEGPVEWTTMEFRSSPRSSMMPLYYPRSLTWAHTFHRGVQCDWCGMYPITGPRFKSLVKENYDLCRYCFSDMGNEAEYTRMERPAFQCPYLISGEAQKTHGRYAGSSHPPKLESLFVKDVTVMDGTVMRPCTPFIKIWRMRNNGTVAWPLGTHLLWTGGSPLGTRESFNIEVANNGCPVDHEIDIAIDLTSPSEPGSYTSFWRLATSSGETFGQRIWVQIEVEKPQTSSDAGGFHHVLNLNLPPQFSDRDLFGIIDMNAVPSHGAFTRTNFPEPWDMPVVTEPTNESLAPYPDVSSLSVFSEVTETAETAQSEAAAADNSVEQAMLKELEVMGFMHIDLNKEVLRENEYDLEQSVDELCDFAEWDPLLTELQGMGFHDKMRNKKLLVKNGGSIKRVVLDLISGEQ